MRRGIGQVLVPRDDARDWHSLGLFRLSGHVRGRRIADLRQEQALRVLAAGYRRRHPGIAASLAAEKQHVPVPSTGSRADTAESDAAPAIAQVSGAETGHCLAQTGAEAAAAAVPRLVVHPQVPRGHRPVQHRRGLLHDADDLGRRDDATVGVQRRHLVSTTLNKDLIHCY